MGLLLNVMFCLCASTEGAFIQGLVSSESGFEGATTVVSETVDGDFGVVVATIPYLDIYGERQEGLGRLVVHRRDVESGRLIPPFCHVHYEKDVGGAKHWAEQGWAVTTAVYDEEHPIDASPANGNNLARAIIQWSRRLPFIDRTHLHIDGGSQGGYMALAMSAAFFPVAATTADAPVVNWAYNLSYLEANKPVSGYPDRLQESPLPIMAQVTMLSDWCYRYFGNDLSENTWYHISPIAHVDRITSPVMVTAATGDMLVPMEQMTREGIHAFESERFPEGYQRDFDSLTLNPLARHTLEELIPDEERFVHRASLQEHSFELTLEFFQDPGKMPEQRPSTMERVWSQDHQWSLFYMDEGPPVPQAPHTSYYWATTPDSFVQHYQQATPSPDILNAAKLERLMQRYSLCLSDLPLLKDGTPVNRLNFASLEKQDALQALLDYAAIGQEHRGRLVEVYAQIATQPFGEVLDLAEIEQLLAR